jgi:hypothetical protein
VRSNARRLGLAGERWPDVAASKRRPFTRFGAGTSLVHGGAHSPAKNSGVTIRIRHRILNARLAAEAVSGGGVDQAYDGWWVVSEFEFQQWGG